MVQPGCPFCTRLQARETPLIDEPLVVAFVEEHPHAIGHAVLIPRRHVDLRLLIRRAAVSPLRRPMPSERVRRLC